MYRDDMRQSERSNFIASAISSGALEFVPEGRELKSGRCSPYFFNSGKFGSGSSIAVIASAYAQAIYRDAHQTPRKIADLLYGPPYKGTILAPVVAMRLCQQGFGDIGLCSSRKEVKSHGEGGLFIGAPITPGSRVLIIDDVITDGGTKREAVELIRKHGGVPIGLCIAFDRQERGEGRFSASQEFEREYGIPVIAVATLADLISFLEKKPSKERKEFQEILKKILLYQEKYGC